MSVCLSVLHLFMFVCVYLLHGSQADRTAPRGQPQSADYGRRPRRPDAPVNMSLLLLGSCRPEGERNAILADK